MNFPLAQAKFRKYIKSINSSSLIKGPKLEVTHEVFLQTEADG